MKKSVSHTNATDEKLINDFLEGNDAAFEMLLERHLSPVLNFLWQLVRDRDTAEDLAQETFFKVWKNLRRFDPNKNFKVWLFAIAKNTAYDFFKKKKTLPFSLFTDEEGHNQLEKLDDKKPWPDEILERKDLAREIEGKLEEIPEAYRIILLMHYKEDFSLSEISEILNVPYNTVKSQHQRGLERLKKAIIK